MALFRNQHTVSRRRLPSFELERTTQSGQAAAAAACLLNDGAGAGVTLNATMQSGRPELANATATATASTLSFGRQLRFAILLLPCEPTCCASALASPKATGRRARLQKHASSCEKSFVFLLRREHDDNNNNNIEQLLFGGIELPVSQLGESARTRKTRKKKRRRRRQKKKKKSCQTSSLHPSFASSVLDL